MPISINGTGTITGISVGGLPDGCISEADLSTAAVTTDKIAAGAVTTPKLTGGPAFSAFRTTNQTITNSVGTKVQLTGEAFDTANCFDSTTNYRFTPNVAGYYNFNFSVSTNSSTNQTNAILSSVWKNGGQLVVGSYTYSSSAYVDGRSSGSVLTYMNGSTDYLELYIFVIGSGTLNVNGANLDGFLARPA